ncbi:MAG: replication and repair protein RecF protein [Candidatus Amesbacteria bacterium GW2011_GWA2_47_11b]|uniref:DNA replication and repair protein RecF n=2 Tax=Candidatus Amesiibacteriota TaxID=1752730 RepID=A0A0G1VI36_9BACT|nr:MAG: replication and repair protein RecF protein [Microgenomates group bacterium GW2011_GWC1_46_20]KKU57148.1 MAG: replication and repair protein RecF protein [Candidatus Amesbacteria bacterium GW2011_GWA2_47_11b]KKU69705.1 MAG: replication and repair protein RecF protein [Candidatus Amesbacteria bacterium GW2011_GWA1_47_20]
MSGLTKIHLQNFRSYEKRSFSFGEKTVIVGENGSGKSNLMEAVYMLATGKSFRADREDEMLKYGEGFFRVIGQIRQMGQIGQMEITMADARKRFLINGVPRRQIDFVGKMRAVLFCPQDMELVTGSPGGRRRYLDFVISQMDREYRRCLISYEKGLRQRNKLLEMIREGLAQRSQLFFWDKLLIKNGEYITLKRGEYLEGLAEYDKSVISEARLKQYEVEEVAAAATLVGPHRDDFVVNIDGRDVSKYGSRGEQRMAVLGLKEKEIEYLFFDSAQDSQQPLLLLDDILSELDHKHRDEVQKMVKDYPGQVIMTTVDDLLPPGVGELDVIRLV